MKERTLFSLSITGTLIGLIILFFIAGKIEVKEIDVEKITSSDIGKEVRVIGKIERVTDSDKMMFLEVGQEKVETVSVVLFKEEDIKLKKGDYVELIGELDDYNGSINIIANCVKVR